MTKEELARKYARRIQSAWNPEKPKRCKTDHEEARKYSAKGWCGYASREDYMNSIRYKGVFTL